MLTIAIFSLITAAFILFLPFINQSRTISFIIAAGAALISTCIFGSEAYSFASEHTLDLNITHLLNFNHWNFNWQLRFTSVTLFLCTAVSLIALFIIAYSLPYAANKANPIILMRQTLMVAFLCLAVITSNSPLVMVFFCALLSAAMYTAINFHQRRERSNQAAFIELALNLCADSFLLGTAVITLSSPDFTLCGWFAAIAALIKGGCVGFGIWVSDTMEAPSPTAALLNAIIIPIVPFVIIFSFAPFFSETINNFLILIGALTAILGALSAGIQYEIKKILAFLTISFNGIILILLAQKNYELALSFIMVHACGKALLYLSYANVIQAASGDHDLRNIGGLGKILSFSYFTSAIGSLAVLFLIAVFVNQPLDYWLLVLSLVIAFLSGISLFRPFLYLFFGPLRGEDIIIARLAPEKISSRLITGILTFFTVGAVYIFIIPSASYGNLWGILSILLSVITVLCAFKHDLSFNDFLKLKFPLCFSFLKEGLGNYFFYYRIIPFLCRKTGRLLNEIPLYLYQQSKNYLPNKINKTNALPERAAHQDISMILFLSVAGLTLALSLALLIMRT